MCHWPPAWQIKSRRLTTVFMSTPCQGKMAISLPTRVIGDTPLQDAAKHREEFTTDSYDNIYSGFFQVAPGVGNRHDNVAQS
jgi:hypothetical protein